MTDGPRRATTVSLLALAVAFGACGGKSDGGGAVVPDGGVCGNYPLCVATLMESCLVLGSCTIATTGDMYVFTFGTGVVETIVTDTQNQRQTVSVTTADGTTTCYTVQTTGMASGRSVVWQNPAGATVATGVMVEAVNPTDNYIDVTCAGGGTARVTNPGACYGATNACTVAP